MEKVDKRAVFLDRDGVLNHLIDRGDSCFVSGRKVRFTAPWKYEEFRLFDRVSKSLQKLREAGFICILATNQPDLAYGLLFSEDHERIMTDVRSLPLDDIFVCPHGRDEGCECKKPKPGMLLLATEKWNIDFSSSFVIGDTNSDVKTGKLMNCRTILINSPATEKDANDKPDFVVANLKEAVNLIVNRFVPKGL
ncbi:MAG: hypothetical protein A2653_03395 [Candidatus Zambryskibacteria bacterium RIFCSPHIGHO2_01_FULL_43_25]|uniref:D,D-heptose 1,7-bisphosphate phosphatase n=1 Tax=Candidatus Zambryskibacteria bacterium RIFCSPLOWO2_01_FULL_45_21 TaxID=1802761 RepID=A0A1G2U1N9_9BACT|nr:MAG: hypothetical protein A2653_03395 [Candidatus Zambryskibacteria bacterium RIFCSPHIGHO2_01_FULL_43_25]OHB00181.1 MAG: hypothetical protein A3E94_01185 [Candidatus Zambryskibacteria bacterium RIFCSPHIGHO2_12_FULL_44_12b]OHB03446.1 MAG: hypothetical protein A3B14_02865 [Candidatus Zambryskibacteria bacterium RIFCSPLOWO2_01_FULL_45_21]